MTLVCCKGGEKMKDRLIELLTDDLEGADNPLMFAYEEIVERIADYLLENGAIVPLLKVGQTVWVKNLYYKTIKAPLESRKILSVQLYKNGDIQYHYKDGCFYQWCVGVTVFLSKEEALKEGD